MKLEMAWSEKSNQSDIIASLSHGTTNWFSPVSVANELTAQHSNTC